MVVRPRGASRTEPSLFVAVSLQRRTHKPDKLTLQLGREGGHRERQRDPDTFWIFISFHLSDRYSGLIGTLSLCTCLCVLLFVNWTFNSFDLANPPPWLPRAAGTGKLCDLQLSPRTEYVPFQIGRHSLAEMPFFVHYSAICVGSFCDGERLILPFIMLFSKCLGPVERSHYCLSKTEPN